MKKLVETTDPQRRRRKCKTRVQKWMRNQTVFRLVIFLAVQAYRLWRLWDDWMGGRGG